MRFKLRGAENKWALRRVADAHLPAVISRRGKMGFPVEASSFVAPHTEFFRGGFLEQTIALAPRQVELCAERYPESYFRFVSAEIWGQMFFLGALPEMVADRLQSATEAVKPSSSSPPASANAMLLAQ
jgi:hypothetical protein